jgi:NitT/TauT family transport system substrate-binding protein
MNLASDRLSQTAGRIIQFIVSALFLFPFNALAAEKIRMSVSGSYNITYIAAGVAQHKGYFRDEGLDADIVVMTAPASLAALTNGDLDYTLLTGSVIRAAIRGLPLRLVAGLMSSSGHVFLARPEIKSIKELAGKRIGLAGFGDATHVLARIILAKHGVDPDKDVQFVGLGSDAGRFAGLQQNLVDMVITSPPWDFEGKKLGYNVLTRAYEHVNYPLAGLGVTQKSLQSHRVQVKALIRSFVRASRFVRENREESVKILMAWGKIKAEHAFASYDSTVKIVTPDGSIPEDGLKLLIDQAKRDLKVTRDVAPTEIADFTLLREVQKELGLR